MLAPSRWSGLKKSPGKCSDPSNMRCSKRCANPRWRRSSFLEPTWYQRFTETTGNGPCRRAITSIPFASVVLEKRNGSRRRDEFIDPGLSHEERGRVVVTNPPYPKY